MITAGFGLGSSPAILPAANKAELLKKDANLMKIEILIFQYVSVPECKQLYERLKNCNLPKVVVNTPIGAKEPTCKKKPSDDTKPPQIAARRDMWDYPHFREWRVDDPRELLRTLGLNLIKFGKGFSLTEFGSAMIEELPSHYPIPYTLWLIFSLELPAEESADDVLKDATAEAKRIAKAISGSQTFPYSPIFWFQSSSNEQANSFAPGAVKIEIQHSKIAHINRIFGAASYHISNADLTSTCASLSALGFLSSVVHLVERHHRRTIHDNVANSLDQFFCSGDERKNEKATVSGSTEELARHLHEARLKLSRLQGLVGRTVQNFGGSDGKLTLYNVLALDALSSLENERAVSIENASLLTEAMNSNLALQYQKEANRISRIAQYIQATLVAGVAFQAAQAAMSPSTAGGHLLTIGIAILLGVVTILWLRSRFS